MTVVHLSVNSLSVGDLFRNLGLLNKVAGEFNTLYANSINIP